MKSIIYCALRVSTRNPMHNHVSEPMIVLAGIMLSMLLGITLRQFDAADAPQMLSVCRDGQKPFAGWLSKVLDSQSKKTGFARA